MNSIKMSSTSGLTLRLHVVGIPTNCINPLVGLIQKWVTCSGEQWAVDRLKSLKLLIISLRANTPYECSFAKNKHGEYKGVIGYLIRLSQTSDKNFQKVVNAFMAYSNYVSVTLTNTQRKKFLKAVKATKLVIPTSFVDLIHKSARKVIHARTVTSEPCSLLTYRGSPTKWAPTLYGRVKQDSHLLSELMVVRNIDTWNHIKGLWDPIYKSVFKGIDIHTLVDTLHDDVLDYEPMIAGEVHFIQEPGYKLRSIASPYRLFQVASKPLQNDLKVCVQSCKWDCTHDQTKAFGTVQEALRNGKHIHSVDLSNATDYFPLDLQVEVLRTVYGKDSPQLKLFVEISTARFNSEVGIIRWNKGQPLGFNPSFFLFTLTHGLLLYGLNGYKWDHDFFVVGDDVLILNDTLYHNYINALSTLGCPYSKDKSTSSNKLAEFVGKLILPDHICPQLKWRDVSDNNFIDLAREIGPRIRKLLSKKQNKVIDVFSHASNLVHPYGLNWSFPGSNLGKMIKIGLDLQFEQSVLSSLTGLSKYVHKQLYADYGHLTNDLITLIKVDEVTSDIRTFDEKVRSVYLQLGYGQTNIFDHHLDGLKSIPEAHYMIHGGSRMLPLESVLPARITLLQRLFGFLKNPK